MAVNHETQHLEPGLLQVLRLFVGLRLAFALLSLLLVQLQQTPRLLRFPILPVCETALLLGYLFWPWLRGRLGRVYLPIALAVLSLGPSIEHALSVALRLRTGILGAAAGSDIWILYVLLFVPLVLLAWQYNFMSVIAYSLGTAALDLMLAVPMALRGGPPLATVVALLFLRSLLFIVVGYLVVRLMRAQRSQREALAQANARLVGYASTLEHLAASRERNRLARELHDTLAHALSAAAVQLEAVSSIWDRDPAGARAMLAQSLTLIRDGLAEARRAIAALRAAPLEEEGVLPALRNLAEATAARAGLQLDVQLPTRLDGLAPEVESALYRIAQESLTNVARHAQAQALAVRLALEGRRLVLTISDDGRGFDAPFTPAASREGSGPGTSGGSQGVPAGEHYGLQGMRERAAATGGTLDVQSWPGQGTTVRYAVEVPDGARVDL
jgi:signal transduction histidine kinase